jgi:hypothetical protein
LQLSCLGSQDLALLANFPTLKGQGSFLFLHFSSGMIHGHAKRSHCITAATVIRMELLAQLV